MITVEQARELKKGDHLWEWGDKVNGVRRVRKYTVMQQPLHETSVVSLVIRQGYHWTRIVGIHLNESNPFFLHDPSKE